MATMKKRATAIQGKSPKHSGRVRWTAEDVAGCRGGWGPKISMEATPAAPTKYRSTATIVDGMRFASKLEARRYSSLKLQQTAGAIRWFTRQIPFWLPGGVVYRADFLIVYSDGSIVVEDTKGFDTPASKTRRRIAEAVYGFKVRVLHRGDFS